MAKKKADEVIERPVSDLAVPSFMQSDERTGTEQLSQFIVPPRLKVIQPLTKAPLKDMFREGDVVMLPQSVMVAGIEVDESTHRPLKTGTPFHFIPVFFFPEWVTWNPRELESLPAIRERSLDPSSAIAVKSRQEATRTEPCPEHQPSVGQAQYMLKHIEHLNFVCVLLGEGMTAGMPVIMTFSRGEHRSGRNLASLIQMRKAPIFGCVFEGRVGFRTNAKGEWYGIDVYNPTVESGQGMWVTDEEQYATLRLVHDEMKANHDRLRPDYSDDPDGETEGQSATSEY